MLILRGAAKAVSILLGVIGVCLSLMGVVSVSLLYLAAAVMLLAVSALVMLAIRADSVGRVLLYAAGLTLGMGVISGVGALVFTAIQRVVDSVA